MAHADFVHLRVHSAYSLLEGALPVKKLVSLCKEEAMPAVAITDTGNLFGALEFSEACAGAGVQPIVGCQLNIARPQPEQPGSRRPAPDPLVLLAQSDAGYANLCRVVSKAYLETEPGDSPQVTLEALKGYADGLLCLTGGAHGPVGRRFLEGRDDAAAEMFHALRETFPDRLYVELQRHGLPEEERLEPAFLGLAYDHGVPLVATNECFFADRAMHDAHDALICVAEGRYLAESDRRKLTPEHYFKSAQEMRELFADVPEAVDNTLVVARRCFAMAEKRDPMLPDFETEAGRSQAEELAVRAREGIERRLERHVFTHEMTEAERADVGKRYRERVEHELQIITNMGFPGYFLIVSDFIQWAKNRGIPVGPGRGSGAGSAVAWALSITDLDPLRFNLLFERFLNPERVSMPDFDVDFCQERRDEVIRYVQEKYGHDKVAQIITFGKLQARAVLRDVGRVLQMPYGQVDRISKLVPSTPANPITLEEAQDQEPQLLRERERDERVARMLDIGMKLEGLYRHASTHAAGVVIGNQPLQELIPLYRDPRADMPVTQFNMKAVEQAGLVKFDFLGLKTLTVLDEACHLIGDGAPDLAALPFDDPATFRMLAAGETVGVFQLESGGMQDVLRRLIPDKFEDVIAVVALYRPGPMENIPRYIACKHGQEEPDYLHPQLEPILAETFGIMIYQEQVMQIAQVLAGYSLGAADLLRRAMGKKIKEEMDKQRGIFIEGAVERGVERATAEHIFDQVAKFANYGFNKSHAASYAYIAYQTAYMKANHPVAFMAASMTYDLQSTEKLAVFRKELDRLGIPLLPPDVNRSVTRFSVETLPDGRQGVRYALAALKNVGEGAVRALVEERETNGPFADLADFARRMDVRTLNRRQLENLVRAGALDSLDGNRRRVFEGIEALLRHAQTAAQERDSNQVSLFGGESGAAPALTLPEVPDWPQTERLNEEAAAIGFYLSAHPMDAYSRTLERLGVLRSDELQGHFQAGGPTRVRMAGILESKRERTSAKTGNRMAFLQLTDTGGSFEVGVFSEMLETVRALIDDGVGAFLVTVDIRQQEDEQLRLSANRVEALDKVAAEAAEGVMIVLEDEGPIPGLADVLRNQKRGRGRVVLVPRTPEREVEMVLDQGIAVSPETLGALRQVPGVGEVREL